jgi:predicted nucleic acid-binding Zn ribbon protein
MAWRRTRLASLSRDCYRCRECGATTTIARHLNYDDPFNPDTCIACLRPLLGQVRCAEGGTPLTVCRAASSRFPGPELAAYAAAARYKPRPAM